MDVSTGASESPPRARKKTKAMSNQTAQENLNLNTITEIQALVQLALSVFTSVWGLFHHPSPPATLPSPSSLTTALQATPGLTEDHKTVIATMVAAGSTSPSTQASA